MRGRTHLHRHLGPGTRSCYPLSLWLLIHHWECKTYAHCNFFRETIIWGPTKKSGETKGLNVIMKRDRQIGRRITLSYRDHSISTVVAGMGGKLRFRLASAPVSLMGVVLHPLCANPFPTPTTSRSAVYIDFLLVRLLYPPSLIVAKQQVL